MGKATWGPGRPDPFTENAILCIFGFGPLTNMTYSLKSAKILLKLI